MANYDVIPRAVGTDPGSAATAAGGISSVAASGGPFVVKKMAFFLFAGGAGADDVTLFAANLPSKMQILNTAFLALATVGSGTVRLYTAAAAGGTALTPTIAAATAGTYTTNAASLGSTAALAANTSIYCRRSDGTVTGILTIEYIETV